ncbi:MAG: CRTAC1 family protein [Armatimonadaceae bacterium]
MSSSFTVSACIVAAVAVAGCTSNKPGAVNNSQTESSVVQFVNVTETSGLAGYTWTPREKRPLTILGTIGNGAAFIDVDNDDNLDVLLVGKKTTLYRGDGKGKFTEDPAAFGNPQGYFLGCAVGDYDNDGFQDVYLTGYRDGRLYRNLGGKKFSDVTAGSGLTKQPWGTSASFADFNRDGLLDLYVANYAVFGKNVMPQLCSFNGIMSSCGPRFYDPERGTLFIATGTGKFAEMSVKTGAKKVSGRGLGVAVLDFDFSGQDSIAIANDELPGDLLKNTGMKFTNEGANSGTAYDGEGRAHGGMGIDWGDYDNDGKPDLVVATFSHEVKSLYHNEGGGFFIDKSTMTGLSDTVQPFITFGIKFFDANNDGFIDLLLSNGHVQDNIADVDKSSTYPQPIFFMQNMGGKRFEDRNSTSGVGKLPPIVGRGLTVGDYDNDGLVDALVVDSEGKPVLLHNESKNVGHFISLRLEGNKSPRSAHGALLRISLPDGKTLLRHCQTDGSYMSASDVRVHVGIGANTSVKSVEITWPSGTKTTVTNVTVDKTSTITEGSSTVR